VLSIRKCLSSKIIGSHFHEYLAKPCLSSEIFGGTLHAKSKSATCTKLINVHPAIIDIVAEHPLVYVASKWMFLRVGTFFLIE
jgi:hypothetical protein